MCLRLNDDDAEVKLNQERSVCVSACVKVEKNILEIILSLVLSTIFYIPVHINRYFKIIGCEQQDYKQEFEKKGFSVVDFV